jgi:3(or 17)beta-hydroxysteroid dehydrogenase
MLVRRRAPVRGASFAANPREIAVPRIAYARVTITDVNEKQGLDVAREIGCDFLALDVTDEGQWARVVRLADENNGGIHVLVNAAGVEGDLSAGSPETTTYTEWRRVHGINLDGTFLGCRSVLPVMKRMGAGSIINISSIVAYFGSPMSVAYGASKAAVQQFSKSVALHGSRDNKRVRCNSVHRA